MSAAAPASGSWADVLGEGRMPRFALICLGVWLLRLGHGRVPAGVGAGRREFRCSGAALRSAFGDRGGRAAVCRRLRAERPGARDLQLPGRAGPAGHRRRLGRGPVLGRDRAAVPQSAPAQGLWRHNLGLGNRRAGGTDGGRGVRGCRFLARGVLDIRGRRWRGRCRGRCPTPRRRPAHGRHGGSLA